MVASAQTVRDALRTVIDPCCRERGISVVDMGLIDEVEVTDHGRAEVRIMLTSGWCPFQTDLLADIESAVRAVPEIAEADVSITLEQAWSTDRLSDSARSRLRFLPEPAEVADREALVAAARGSGSVAGGSGSPAAHGSGPATNTSARRAAPGPAGRRDHDR